MTLLEKKKRIQVVIDNLTEEHLDEALMLIESLANKDENRKKILLELLEKETSLFEKLAQ
jgi:hypothetical protein